MGFVVVAKSCLTVLGPMDCGLPGSSVHGISQARILENESEVTQSCPTLCDPVDCSPPSSSVHGTLQGRILEWVAISFSRGSSRPRDRTQVSHIAGRRFNLCTTREALEKTLILGKTECRRTRGWQRMRRWDGIINTMDMSVSKLREIMKGREDWHGAVHGITKSQILLSDWTSVL